MRRKGQKWELTKLVGLALGLVLAAGMVAVVSGMIGGGELSRNLMSPLSDLTAGLIG